MILHVERTGSVCGAIANAIDGFITLQLLMQIANNVCSLFLFLRVINVMLFCRSLLLPFLLLPLLLSSSFFVCLAQVAWLRVESKTILTIHHHIITRNYRIGLSHSDDRQWNLHLNDVQESDRGGYMCQINTGELLSRTIVGRQLYSCYICP